LDLTPEQRIARHKSFLNANWMLIAAFSWEHYQKEGRGMVVVPEEDFVHLPTPQLKGLRFAYAAKDSDLLGEISTHFEQKEWSWLDSYDPDEKAIVIILREGGGTSGYLIGGRTRPSEAWARQKAKDN
jgi:hypothetical protein